MVLLGRRGIFFVTCSGEMSRPPLNETNCTTDQSASDDALSHINNLSSYYSAV